MHHHADSIATEFKYNAFTFAGQSEPNFEFNREEIYEKSK